MIVLHLKNDNLQTRWFVQLPHEINNEFLFHVDQYTKENSTTWWYLNVWTSDFGNIEFPPDKLDKLYRDFDILEKNLGEIIKIIPLPKKIWGWESYYPGFVSFYEEWRYEFKKYFPWVSDTEIEDIIHWRNWIEHPTDFTSLNMLLIISLIKKKILEAKEKNETLVFSGD